MRMWWLVVGVISVASRAEADDDANAACMNDSNDPATLQNVQLDGDVVRFCAGGTCFAYDLKQGGAPTAKTVDGDAPDTPPVAPLTVAETSVQVCTKTCVTITPKRKTQDDRIFSAAIDGAQKRVAIVVGRAEEARFEVELDSIAGKRQARFVIPANKQMMWIDATPRWFGDRLNVELQEFGSGVRHQWFVDPQSGKAHATSIFADVALDSAPVHVKGSVWAVLGHGWNGASAGSWIVMQDMATGAIQGAIDVNRVDGGTGALLYHEGKPGAFVVISPHGTIAVIADTKAHAITTVKLPMCGAQDACVTADGDVPEATLDGDRLDWCVRSAPSEQFQEPSCWELDLATRGAPVPTFEGAAQPVETRTITIDERATAHVCGPDARGAWLCADLAHEVQVDLAMDVTQRYWLRTISGKTEKDDQTVEVLDLDARGKKVATFKAPGKAYVHWIATEIAVDDQIVDRKGKARFKLAVDDHNAAHVRGDVWAFASIDEHGWSIVTQDLKTGEAGKRIDVEPGAKTNGSGMVRYWPGKDGKGAAYVLVEPDAGGRVAIVDEADPTKIVRITPPKCAK
jgi:hypothetical protein